MGVDKNKSECCELKNLGVWHLTAEAYLVEYMERIHRAQLVFHHTVSVVV